MSYNSVKNSDLTPQMRAKLNSAYKMLKVKTTKEEIMKYLGVSERSARDLISYIKKVFPVISNSASKGYRIAQTEDDLADAEQTVSEIKSRIQDLQEGIKPLEKFMSEMEARQ